MGAQFNLVQHVLQRRIGKGFMAPRHGDRQLVQGGAGNAAGQQAVTHRIQQVQQLLAMRQALGAAGGSVVHALQHEDGIQRGNGARAGHDLAMRFGWAAHGKAARGGAGGCLALHGGGLDTAGSLDFHRRVPLRHISIAHHG